MPQGFTWRDLPIATRCPQVLHPFASGPGSVRLHFGRWAFPGQWPEPYILQATPDGASPSRRRSGLSPQLLTCFSATRLWILENQQTGREPLLSIIFPGSGVVPAQQKTKISTRRNQVYNRSDRGKNEFLQRGKHAQIRVNNWAFVPVARRGTGPNRRDDHRRSERSKRRFDPQRGDNGYQHRNQCGANDGSQFGGNLQLPRPESRSIPGKSRGRRLSDCRGERHRAPGAADRARRFHADPGTSDADGRSRRERGIADH
jgi:hypothetical protein